ncbi:acyltransferase family protein [Raoultibacter phocaeensis]|uniref:acyltransferase family protein n=1 Tax=Raoultibacter phocaeensis TaxID=2479841 RepID=UPI001117F46A|nr:acyltransferase [Raoultibacter phocaeensis]
MPENRAYPAIDLFRMVAALFVVAIHTAPFASISPELDDAITYTLERIAVPFFLATTGFFVLSRHRSGSILASRSFRVQLGKLCALYAVATVLYLPVSIYAGTLPASLPEALQAIVFEGTFYHLWYFPAAILGSVVTAFLLDRFGLKATAGIALALFAIGLFGDSYWGLASRSDALRGFYDVVFSVAPHTRNGLFYAPAFLAIGVLAARRTPRIRCEAAKQELREPADYRRRALQEPEGDRHGRWLQEPEQTTHARNRRDQIGSLRSSALGLVVSLAVLIAEGAAIHGFGLDRHDSMYVLLLPTTYFLMNVLAASKIDVNASWARDLSLWIYILHPLCIVLVRGIAKAFEMTELVVGDSLLFFAAVCLASVLLSLAVMGAKSAWKQRRTPRSA